MRLREHQGRTVGSLHQNATPADAILLENSHVSDRAPLDCVVVKDDSNSSYIVVTASDITVDNMSSSSAPAYNYAVAETSRI